MNEVFPPLQAVSIATAVPASIVRISRHDDPLLAFVTDQTSDKGNRSVVVLNAKLNQRPPIFFAKDWPRADSCLAFSGKLHFQLSTRPEDVDPRGRSWEDSGVIVCLGDQFYLRAALNDAFAGEDRFVNIQSGSILEQPTHEDAWTFGVWRVWIRDLFPERSSMIFEFNIHKQA